MNKESAMNLAMFDLPPSVYWFSFGDQTVFAVYGASGGLQHRQIRYLIKKGDGPMPQSLRDADLGLPERGRIFSVVNHERGWKHAPIWNECDPHSFQACIKELTQ